MISYLQYWFQRLELKCHACIFLTAATYSMIFYHFISRKFRGYKLSWPCDFFFVVCESLYSRNRSVQIIHESLYPQKFSNFWTRKTLFPQNFLKILEFWKFNFFWNVKCLFPRSKNTPTYMLFQNLKNYKNQSSFFWYPVALTTSI